MHISNVNEVYKPDFFAVALNDNIQRSKVTMTMGGATTNDAEYELFEAMGPAIVEANVTVSVICVGRTSGMSSKHLFKKFGSLMKRPLAQSMLRHNSIAKIQTCPLLDTLV